MDQIVIFCAKYLFAATILVLFVVWVRATRRNKVEIALASLLAGAVAYILIKVANGAYYDPRPFVTQHINPLVPIGADNGFPSEHTVFTMTLSSVIYLYNRRLGVTALIITAAVGISRVLAHVHSPIDVVVGVVIGAVAGVAGYAIASKLVGRFKE
jgi:undecaprenyl-diphosphatase